VEKVDVSKGRLFRHLVDADLLSVVEMGGASVNVSVSNPLGRTARRADADLSSITRAPCRKVMGVRRKEKAPLVAGPELRDEGLALSRPLGSD
jgi:hypothetical protein